MNEAAVKRLFERYERLFNQAVGSDNADMDAIAALYVSEFIGAAPRRCHDWQERRSVQADDGAGIRPLSNDRHQRDANP